MFHSSARLSFARVAFGVAVPIAVLALGALLDARQAQPPAQNPPPQTAAAQPAAGRGTQPDTGPVKDDRNAVIGFTKLAEIPGTPWRIHDASRPHPRVVTPGATPGAPPADAIVLFDGKDL